MPNPGADAPLRKVTLNLYEEDCAKLEQAIGDGWTTRIRDVMQEYCKTIETIRLKRRTVGDLDDNR